MVSNSAFIFILLLLLTSTYNPCLKENSEFCIFDQITPNPNFLFLRAGCVSRDFLGVCIYIQFRDYIIVSKNENPICQKPTTVET